MNNHGKKQGKGTESKKPERSRGFKESGKKKQRSKPAEVNTNPTAKRINSEELPGPNTKQQRSPVIRSPNPQPPNPNRSDRPFNLREALDAQRNQQSFSPLDVENSYPGNRVNVNNTNGDHDDALATGNEPPSPMIVEKEGRTVIPPSPMLVERRARGDTGDQLDPPPSPMCIDEKRQPAYLVHPLRERKPPKPKSESAVSTPFSNNAFGAIGTSAGNNNKPETNNGAPRQSNQHHQQLQHFVRYDRFPWYGVQVRSRFPVGALHTELLQFCQYIKPTPQECALRACVVDKLRPVVSKLWPQAQVKVFGSYDTKLFLPTSDIDCSISGQDFQPLADVCKLFNAIQAAKLTHPDYSQALPWAKVPIVKYVDLATNICVDVSFNTINGLENSQIVKNLLQEYEVLEYLVLFLKYFLSGLQLNETYTGGIGSYGLVLMVTAFLENNIEAKNANFRLQQCDLGALLIAFFKLFGQDFDYETTAINAKRQFYTKSTSNESAALFQLNIEDPHDSDNDVGKASFAIHKIRAVFDLAYKRLSETNEKNGSSNLSRILVVDKQLIECRKRYANIYVEMMRVQALQGK